MKQIAYIRTVGTTGIAWLCLVHWYYRPRTIRLQSWEVQIIDERLKELSFQNKGIYLELIDRRKDEEVKKEYYSENGLLDFIKYLNESKTPIHQNPIIFEGERNVDNTQMFGEVCIQFTDSTTEYIASYVNNIPTTEAGTHESGFKTGMTRAFKEWAKKLGLVKEKDKEFEGDDLREGMTAIVRIKITNPVFEDRLRLSQEVQKLIQ